MTSKTVRKPRTYKSKTRFQPVELEEDTRELVNEVVAAFEKLGAKVTKRSVVNEAVKAGIEAKYSAVLAR